MVEMTDATGPTVPKDVDARGCKTGCAILGCGCLVLILAVAGLAIYGAMTYRTWGTRIVRDMVCAPITDSDLTEAHRAGFTAVIDRTAEAGRNDTLAFEDFLRLLTLRESNPFLPIALIDSARQRFIPASGLDPEARADADLVFRRFCFGALEYTVSDWDTASILGLMAVEEVPPVRHLRASLGNNELSGIVEEMRRMADEAGVRDLPPEIDYTQRFGDYINEIVNGVPALPAEIEDDMLEDDGEAMDAIVEDSAADEVDVDTLDEPLIGAAPEAGVFTCNFEDEPAGGTMGDIEAAGPGSSACLASVPSRDAQYAAEAVVFLPEPFRMTAHGEVTFRFRLSEGGRLMMCRLAVRTEEGEALDAQYVHIALRQDEWNTFKFGLKSFRTRDGAVLPAAFTIEAIHFLGGFKPVELNARLFIDDIVIRE